MTYGIIGKFVEGSNVFCIVSRRTMLSRRRHCTCPITSEVSRVASQNNAFQVDVKSTLRVSGVYRRNVAMTDCLSHLTTSVFA